MAKTACEEAADYFDPKNVYAEVLPDIHKRLRAEGRELRRLRKWNYDRYHGTIDQQLAATVGLQRFADRIQKARTKK